MSETVTDFPELKTGLSWATPTANVDTSVPFNLDAEVTGYEIGVRALGDDTHSAGNYAVLIPVAGNLSTTESKEAATAAAAGMLVPGKYIAAVRDVGPTDSAFSAEVGFTIPAPPPPPVPVPQAPSNFAAG